MYEVELRPDDGLYPLPYMARQADGRSWDADGVQEIAPAHQSRQPFFPDGSRPVEEIDRLGIGEHGTGNLMSAYAEIDFFRVLPASGYKKGLPAGRRTDIGEGDIAPEALGKDFFPYRPPHLGQHPPRLGLARIVNVVQAALAGGTYAGAIWTQGSPRIEETLYWLNLLLDTTLPLCGNSAQRAHGMISNDGPKNLVDSVDFITSRVWADDRRQESHRAGADPGAADLRRARSAERRCASRRLCRDRRPRRHPGRHRFRREAGHQLRAGDAAHLPV